MKLLPASILFFLFINFSFSQSEQLEGVWVVDSIFDYDILITPPANLYTVNFSEDITINAYCDISYTSNYQNVQDESFEIPQTTWSPEDCNGENSGYMGALYGLFGNFDSDPNELNYSITNVGGVDKLMVSYDIIEAGIPGGSIGFFTRLTAPNTIYDTTWYLESLTTGGFQLDNYVGLIGLDFIPDDDPNSNVVNVGGGTPCQFNGGPFFIIDDNTFEVIPWAASGSCGGEVAADYTDIYQRVMFDNYITSATPTLNFEIVQDDEFTSTLVFTNSSGETAAFRNIPPPYSKTILKTWYSTGLLKDGTLYYPTSNDVAIEFQKDILGLNFEIVGFGGCNSYTAEYNIYASNDNSFQISLFNQPEDLDCENSTYEDLFFSILSEESTANVSYEMIGDGEGLKLTNTTGDVLYFTDTPPQFMNLTGTWFLDELMIDGNTFPNYYSNESSFEIDIAYIPSVDTTFINGLGACESFAGTFDVTNDELISNTLFDFSLGAGCPNPTPGAIYEGLYFYSFLSFDQPPPINMPYQITEVNGTEILTITNPTNGSMAKYSRTQSGEVLARTWYLSRIETPGNPPIIISSSDSPSLSITTSINSNTGRPTVLGDGLCNGFQADYQITLNNSNSIQLLNWSQTLADCSPSFEDAYFSILSNFATNFSDFEILNDGQNLIITDLLGARLIFNDQPLSIDDYDLYSMNIKLNENPVESILNLDIPSQLSGNIKYTIHDISGKLIVGNDLTSEEIPVSSLGSGLYFVQFRSDKGQMQTIKFVKQ